MIIVFISGVFPAWKATRIDPLEVLGGNSEIRVGSDRLRSLTSWLPSLLGLSIRSSLRKPVRLSMTFLAVGVSLMLAGSIQMMTVSLQDTIVGGLRDGQSWDAQVYIQSDGESSVIDWAEENGASYEIIIETPIGTITDSSGMQRSITLVGLNSYSESESMRNVELIDGKIPIPDSSVPQVIMDEGSLEMSGWSINQRYLVLVGDSGIEVEVVGSARGEISRTIFFLQSDLANATGINATSVYLLSLIHI